MATSTSPPQTHNDVATRLRLAITRTARRLRQEAGGELTPSQAAALAAVERHGPLTPSELAEREQVRRPTATRIIACLEDATLVARTPDPADGRSALIDVTPEGRALIRRLRRRKTAYLARRLDGLDRAEIAALERAAGILERLLEVERA
jgi:DNA-binding MarR family transcriptional regulator